MDYNACQQPRGDPLKVHRTDRRRTAVAGLVFGLSTGLVIGLATGLASGSAIGLAIGLVSGLLTALGFAVVIGAGAAMWLGVAQVVWLVRGRPVRFIPLLETALRQHVLRQAGSVYQFRHAALQDYLAGLHTSSGARTHSQAGEGVPAG